MDIAKADLTKYIGGQVEASNLAEGYVYRGDIDSIQITPDNKLSLKLGWMARLQQGNWIVDPDNKYEVEVETCTFSELEEDRIFINNFFVGETATLFPKGGSRLEPSRVQGLSLE